MSMNPKMERSLVRWLRYESRHDEDGAQEALTEALRGLPVPSLPPGFADRVLAASGLAFATRRQLRVPQWVWQSAFGVWLVTSFLVAMGTAGFAVDLAASGQLVALATRLVVSASHLLVDVATVLGGLLRAGTAVSSAFSGPTILLLVLACGLASLTALGALKPLLSSERSRRHVESY